MKGVEDAMPRRLLTVLRKLREDMEAAPASSASNPRLPQSQCIRDHGSRAEAHRQGGNHGGQ